MNTVKLLEKLKSIIQTKKTAVCLSLDVPTWELGYKLLDIAGPWICMVKIHPELFPDWQLKSQNEILYLAEKYNFQIMCDQKMADVPKIVERQLFSPLLGLSKVADWITIMPNNYNDVISYISNIPNFQQSLTPAFILVAQMNTINSMSDDSRFQVMIFDILAQKNRLFPNKTNVIITQRNMYSDMLNGGNFFGMTPGVILNVDDNPNIFRYRDIATAIIRDKNQVVILGAGILGDLAKQFSKTSMEENIKLFMERVKEAAKQSWDALEKQQPTNIQQPKIIHEQIKTKYKSTYV